MADVIMPQMGESIAEGTVTKWLKNVGDKVERDEPLFEISTDKVDAEIPSPAAGVLKEIRVAPGTTVPVNTVVGVIAAEGEAAAAAPPAARAAAAAAVPPPHRRRRAPPARSRCRPPAARSAAARPPPPPAPAPARRAAGGSGSAGDRSRCRRPPAARRRRRRLPLEGEPAGTRREKPRAEMTADELRHTRSSPVVRKIAAEHQVDISEIPGTGIGGRVTKQDILGHIETRRSTPARAPPPAPPLAGAAPSAARRRAPAAAGPRPRRGRAARPGRADVADPQEDRRAHGALEAHLGPRLDRVRDRHDAHRPAAPEAQGRVRGARRAPHLHAVHPEGRGRRARRPSRC